MIRFSLSRFVSGATSGLRPQVRGRRPFQRLATVQVLESRQLLTVSSNFIKAWGPNANGQVSLAPTDQNYTMVAGGLRHGIALKADGSIVDWGSGDFSNYGNLLTNTPTGTGFKAVGAGYSNSFALSTNGTISAWGSNDQSVVSNKPTGSGFTFVTGNWYNGLALASDGSISVWGVNADNQISGKPTGTGYKAIAGGSIYAYAIKSDDTLVAWGGLSTAVQRTGVPTGTYTAIAAGDSHAVALKSDGSLASWGSNTSNQVSNTPTGTDFIAVAAGGSTSYAQRSDGSIVAWGDNGGNQITNAPAGTGFTGIAAAQSGVGFALCEVCNSAPTNITLSASSIAENQAVGTQVGTFSTTDPDTGNTFTYTLVSGTGDTDNASFTIGGTSGNSLLTAASFNFETKSSYSIRVRTTDQEGAFFEKQFTITVLNGNDGATQVVLSNVVTSLLATANTTSAIPLADVSVTDDGLGTNTLSLSGTDAGVFELVANQLRLKAGTVLNYATQKTYSVTVNVDDTTVGGTPDASVDYTLSLQGFDGITVQNGAVGRSYVRYVTLTFGTSQGLAEAVSSIGTATPRIRLLWGGAGGRVWSPRTLTSSMVSVSGSQLLFDFGPQGIGGTANSAVGDGLYRLRVDLDGSVDSAGKRLSEVVANFFRLFGDVDGNGLVNQADVTAVTLAQGTTGLTLAADLDGDGDVDADDLNNVKKRLGARVWL
jgi:hypothetical protein